MSSEKPGMTKETLLSRLEKARQAAATHLDLSGQGLTEIPREIGQLKNLRTLNLSGNKLTSVPTELGQFTNLTRLYLDHNQLTSVPAELGQCTNLTKLYLDHNQLTSVPTELGQFTNLTRLYLDHNQLTSVPTELGQLTNLTRLSLSQNQLTSVPAELGQLTNLTKLYLSQNQLTSVPTELGQLTNLTKLYLYHNQLTSVPTELGQLTNLTALYLSHNQLTSVPTELEQLTNLTALSLDRNQLTKVPECIEQLTKLQRMDLNNNELTTLPRFLEQLPNLNALLLHENKKLTIPNETLGPTDQEVNDGATPANPKDILNYYFRILADRQPLNEAKLILVGFGAVGKTSLVNRLVHKRFDPALKKTEGIQITQWPISLQSSENQNPEDIMLNVWDFGGQEIMHSTHQFFLTERSLYVLVLNGRQGHEDTDAEYWLELIRSFGGNSPIIVVLNKVHEQPFDLNRGDLQQKFPAIRDFIKTDCDKTNPIGIESLRATIKRETDRLEHLRDPFPYSWVNIKKRLTDMSDNYISFEKYREICTQDGENNFSAQNSLAVHLHNLGIALNYKDDPRLRDTHVLNPLWVTKGIYTLINDHEVTEAKGELEISCLDRILDNQNYPSERHGFLLELMRKFELCFRFEEHENRYLIPDLLDKQQPDEAKAFNLSACLNFRYDYPVLPEGLLPRFIVRTHVLVDKQLRWRTGVILTFEGNRALVKADPQDRCVTISVDGPLSSRRRLLAVIRSDFDRIHRSFKFKPKELVPVPGHPNVTVSYKELLTREKQNRTSFEVFLGDDELLDLKVQDLLNGVDMEGSRQRSAGQEKRTEALRLFYSYSHKDEGLRDQLDTHLKILERQGFIQPWHDRCIKGGEDWKQEIDSNLEQADIILLLISADFIASDYCYEKELTIAMERHNAGEAQVIPIIIRSVDWQDTPFGKLQGFPKDMKAVTQWSDRDSAWFNVETGIKNTIKTIKAKR